MSRIRRLRGADMAVGGGFFLVGVVSVLLGPIIPELRVAWGITSEQAATLFVSQFVASSLGSVVASLDLERGVVGGYLLVGVGLAALAAGRWPVAPLAVALIGFGLGLVIVGSNLWTAHRRGGPRGSRLATLNLLWGLGAVSCPLFVAALRGRLSIEWGLGALAALAVLACGAVALAFVREDRVYEAPSAPASSGPVAPLGTLALLAGLVFLYVGIENAIGGWLVTVAEDRIGRRAVLSLLVGSGFWAALLAGRGATPWLLRRLDEARAYRLCLGIALGGTVLLVVAPSPAAIAVGGLVAGIGLAPLFPLTVSRLAAATAASRSRQAGWVLACGGFGGALLPWLTGRLEVPGGGLEVRFLVPLGGLVAMAALERTVDPAAVARLGEAK